MSNNAAHDIVRTILEKRGIAPDEQALFLSPEFERDTHDPSLIMGMDKAVARIEQALGAKERIVIFGDYDADGVPATALMVRVLRGLGHKDVQGVIPTRQQGYGLTGEVVQDILSRQPKLVITVDNGTVAPQEVAALVAGGCDVIVIDHHEAQEGKIAEAALAIINPKVPGSAYPFRELCACALAWKTAWALYEKLGKDPQPLKWELDLVALSTIADMVPLIGENRVLATFGLRVLRKTKNSGLKALAEVAGISLESLSAGDVGFKLAPRINATSRMHASQLEGEDAALMLLSGEDTSKSVQLANYLNKQNMERQELVDRHLIEAEEYIAAYKDAPVLVAYNESWSTGVIGLVASRLMERYRRPAIVLAPEGGEIKGSVRTVDGVHALELLDAAAAELERFGGHAKAAGLTMKKEGNVEGFRSALVAHMEGLGISLEELAARNERTPDAEVALCDVSLELAQELEKLQPFGIGFPAPLLAIEAEPQHVRAVGREGKHVSFFLMDGAHQCKAIAFSYRGPQLNEGKRYRFGCIVEVEEWRNVKSAVCHIRRVEELV